jgi:2-oxoglutarate-Fe(II)-dependent oxygenase superfamily protein
VDSDEPAVYAAQRYLLLPELLPPTDAARLADMHGNDDRWRSYRGHEAHEPVPAVYEFFRDASQHVLGIVGRVGEYTVDAWVNRYRLGGHIVRHTDHGRSDEAPVATLNVCLASPPPENGGELVLAFGNGEVRLHLRAGDAVVFDGASIEHWTTDLVATGEEPEPFRMVAVGRYYVGSGA